jgi:hypothetical protein
VQVVLLTLADIAIEAAVTACLCYDVPQPHPVGQ